MREWFLRLRQRISPLLTPRNQRILFAVTIFFAGLAIYDVTVGGFPYAVSLLIYICAAVSFFSSLPLWILTLRVLFVVGFASVTAKNKYIAMYVHNYRLRTILGALPGLGLSFIFGLYNAAIGLISSSAWHGSLALYYILMCAMRFSFAVYAKSLYVDKKEQPILRELRIYKSCGIMLLITSIALFGAVAMLVFGGESGKDYPGMLIYVMAAYTFYKLPVSIINAIRAKNEKSPLLITLCNIGNAEAMVAILSLQTAMFTQFAGEAREIVVPMNALTGSVVCVAVTVMGLWMLWDAKKRRIALQKKEEFQ